MVELVHLRCLNPPRRERGALRLCGASLTIDYAGLACATEALAKLLVSAGIGRASRVALLAPASIEFTVAVLAAARVGAAVAPIDISARGLSLAAPIERLAPHAVIGSAGALRRLPPSCSDVRVLIAFEELIQAPGPALTAVARVSDATQSLRLPLCGEPEGTAFGVVEGARPDDDLLLIATSGSTGQPKDVRLGHQAILFNAAGHLASFGLHRPFRALQALEVTYSYGLVASLLSTLIVGGMVVLPTRNDARGIRDAIRAESPTVCLASPALIDQLIDSWPIEEHELVDRLVKLGIGGDHCHEPLRCKIAAFMPGIEAYVTYGATEAGPRIATLPPTEFLARPHAVGLPLDGVELCILDANGQPCAPGAVGMLQVRTPSKMNGYLGDSSDSSADDWLSIGDLASLDADGFLTIHGRVDRQFKHRGRRINPAEIELMLERFPGVLSARVEPVADEEPLRAAIYHRPDAANDIVVRLREYCRRNLPHRLVPGEITCVVESEGYFFKGKRLAPRRDATAPTKPYSQTLRH